MKNWQILSIAAAALTLGTGLSLAVAGGPQRPFVQAVTVLDATGNGSARGVWIVAEDGSAKYCVAGKIAATSSLPPPNCSPWNISMRYAAPKVN